MVKRIHAVVTGRVQNVGFRMWALHRAEAQGLTGWVKNSADYRKVELEAQGDEAAIDDLIRDLHEGPPSARVTAVEIDSRPLDEGGDYDFHMR